jgi:hypothetical protein
LNIYSGGGNGGTLWLVQTTTTLVTFEGNFTPIPFEFEASGGIAIWGGAWLLRKQLQKRKVTKD